MLTPEEINETNAKVHDQIQSLLMIVNAKAMEPRTIEGEPDLIKISYDGQGGCRRIEWIAVENEDGLELDLPDFSVKSDAFMLGPNRLALDLVGNILELARIENWAKDDGSRGDIVINHRTGAVEDIDHEVRAVTYETAYIDMSKLLKDVPVGPTPG